MDDETEPVVTHTHTPVQRFIEFYDELLKQEEEIAQHHYQQLQEIHHRHQREVIEIENAYFYEQNPRPAARTTRTSNRSSRTSRISLSIKKALGPTEVADQSAC